MNRTKKTGFEWAEKLGVTVNNPKGWQSEKQFVSELMTKHEFLLRAANSEIKATHPITRRAAAKMLKKI